MTQPAYQKSISPQTPPTPKKSGCGCWLWGCMGTLLVLLLIAIGSGVTFWYGMKHFVDAADPVVLWTYRNMIRPEVVEKMPPNMPAEEKNRILDMMDSGVEKYTDLTTEEKGVLLKEAITAAYYLSQDQIVPPEKIPNLSEFIKEHAKKTPSGR